MKGAPIRFVAAVVGGWVCVRIAVLMPAGEPLELAEEVLAPPAAAASRPTAIIPRVPLVPASKVDADRFDRAMSLRLTRAAVARPSLPARLASPAPMTKPDDPARASDREASPSVLIPATLGTPPSAQAVSRLAASAWLLARGGASGTLTGGQLGASQAGARATYLIDRGYRIALAARIATPLRGRGTEAAFGVDWQPTAAPVHLVVEQRIAIDGARGGPTAMAIAGLDPTPIAAGFRLEAYAQGGAILRDGKAEAFGDGAARLARPVAAIGGARVDLGLGAWAAGQRGAARVDVGPTVGVALPVTGRTLRLSLDWRQRVAGDARPGSGPALSIGSDF